MSGAVDDADPNEGAEAAVSSRTDGDAPTSHQRDRAISRPPRSKRGPLQYKLVTAIAVVTAFVAMVTTPAQPTTSAAANLLWIGGFAALIVGAASRARRWSLVFSSGLLSFFTVLPWWFLTVAAFIAAASLLGLRRRDRVVGAAVGAGCALGVLHLPSAGLLGTSWRALPLFVATAAVGPLLASGYRRTNRVWRRRIFRVGLLGILGMALVAGVAVLTAWLSRADIETAVRQTLHGAQQARAGDDDAATTSFNDASAGFSAVAGRFSKPWMGPTRWIPVISQNVDAVQRLSDDAEGVTSIGASVAAEIDYDAVRRPDGGVDLDMLRRFAPAASRFSVSVSETESTVAALDTPWLVPQMQSRIERLDTEMHRLAIDADAASKAAALLPDLLGGNGKRRYLLEFANPAESRDLGGLMTAWAILEADNGDLHITDSGVPIDLYSPNATNIQLNTTYPIAASYRNMDPQRWPQNWTSTVDIDANVAVAEDLLLDAGRGHIDGVMYIDPAGLAAMLELTGPMPIPGTELTIDSGTAEEFFLRTQYEVLPQTAESDRALQQLVSDVFDTVASRPLPGPNRLGELFGPLVRGGNIRFATSHQQDDPLLSRVGTNRRLPDAASSDVFGVVLRNLAPNKIDPYLTRSTSVETTLSADGSSVRTEATITISNRAQPAALPTVVDGNDRGLPAGTARLGLAVLSNVPDARLTVDGQRFDAAIGEEAPGLYRYSAIIEVPAGQSIEVSMAGGHTIKSGQYRLTVWNQSAANPNNAIDARLVDSSGRTRQGQALNGHMIELQIDRP